MIYVDVTSCGTANVENSKESEVKGNEYDRETIYQVSLLQGLTFGDYNGSIIVGELKNVEILA